MPLKFPQRGTPQYFAYVEQVLQQHRTDVQRLWKVVPTVAETQQGVPFTGPTSPSAFGGPSGVP